MATYYVDPVNGDDGNSGLTLEDAFASTQAAANAVAAGDEVRLCATGTETPTSTITLVTDGMSTAPIKWIGCDETGEKLEEGFYVLSGELLVGSVGIITFDLTKWQVFEGIRLTQSSGYGIHQTGISGPNFMKRCQLDNNASTALYYRGLWVVLETDFFSNSNAVGQVSASRGRGLFYKCRIFDNSGFGIGGGEIDSFGSNFEVIECLIYNNGGSGVVPTRGGFRVLNCVIYGNGGDGIRAGATTIGLEGEILIKNNVIAGNGGYGITFLNNYSAESPLLDVSYNLFYQNTSGPIDDTDRWNEEKNITDQDPQFADPNNGDFTFDLNSPLITAGLRNSPIALSAAPKIPTPEEVAAAIWSRTGRTLTV